MNHPEKTPDLASGAGAESAASTPAGRPATGVNPRRAVPVLLFLFIFCLVVD